MIRYQVIKCQPRQKSTTIQALSIRRKALNVFIDASLSQLIAPSFIPLIKNKKPNNGKYIRGTFDIFRAFFFLNFF